MPSDSPNGPIKQDWRLQADLDVRDPKHALERLLGRLGRSGVVKDIEASVPDEVVVTHDGAHLFAYAADETALRAARSAIEDVLARDGVEASVRISHWDEESEQWRQTDPPPSAAEQQAWASAQRDAQAVQTRTLVASAGRAVRDELKQSLLSWAAEHGVQCEIVEHPHLLTTQIAFTVTGPKGKLDEFAKALEAEEWATVRTETGVMLSPL